MSQQNRKYYSRSNEILKDELFFKIHNESDHENKFLVEKIEIKNKKKFIKQYKLLKRELDYLIQELTKRQIKIIDSNLENRDNIMNENIMGNHPEYQDNRVCFIDSYKQTIKAKYNEGD